MEEPNLEWTFGTNGTIEISEKPSDGTSYCYHLISYWYTVDKKGRVSLKVAHNVKYISPETFKEVHRCLHEAVQELKFLSKIK